MSSESDVDETEEVKDTPKKEEDGITSNTEITIQERKETPKKEEDGVSSNTEIAKPCSSQADSARENVHYEGGTCVYTDPSSKFQFIWNSTENKWVPRTPSEKNDDTVKSHEHSSDDTKNKMPDMNNSLSKDYKFDGESYIYTNDETGITYKYDTKSSKWVEFTNSKNDVENETSSDKNKEEHNEVKEDTVSSLYSYEDDTHLYTDPTDGTVYIWDRDKNAWFPKVDEDFLAHYQMNYGFIDSSGKDKEEDNTKKQLEEQLAKEQKKRKAAGKEPTWFEMDESQNTKVYVSNLPLDITEEEFVDVMQKCGLVMKCVDTGKMKIKLYTEPENNLLKGDALCTYIKTESVDLALKVLDGYVLRGKKLRVERAKFQMKGAYDPSLKPKKKRKKDKEKLKKIQEKLFDWRPDKLRGERAKHERVVIVKNLFEPKIFEENVSLILEYQQDLREECSKCGVVRKVVIYDRNPEGVAQIIFSDAEEADICVKLLNGRWFGQRRITAEIWDGKTKFKILETAEETNTRLQQWSEFLEGGDSKKNISTTDASGKTEDKESDKKETVDEAEIKS